MGCDERLGEPSYRPLLGFETQRKLTETYIDALCETLSHHGGTCYRGTVIRETGQRLKVSVTALPYALNLAIAEKKIISNGYDGIITLVDFS